MTIKKSKKKQFPSYMNVVQSEVMLSLGQKIHFHRHILNFLMERNQEDLQDLDAVMVMTEMNNLYQSSLDGIFDSLADCADMNLAKEAITAIRDSMNIRRGLVKLEKRNVS